MVFSVLLMIKHCMVDKCILQPGADVIKQSSIDPKTNLHALFGSLR